MYIFFDTETTGLPPRARMAQLAYVLCNENGEIIEKYASHVKPNGWTIPKEKFFIDNNMSTERCEREGKPVKEVLSYFHDALRKAQYKIAHNIQFDNQIVQNEIIIAGYSAKEFEDTKSFCTMLSTVQYVGALNKYGKPGKWPKLEELHRKLYGHDFEDAHDALADVVVTAKCFFELKKRGIIKI
jgi:DNA polymerase-3 subunit alpha/DNA polymerase-3 subunit epsilon